MYRIQFYYHIFNSLFSVLITAPNSVPVREDRVASMNTCDKLSMQNHDALVDNRHNAQLRSSPVLTQRYRTMRSADTTWKWCASKSSFKADA